MKKGRPSKLAVANPISVGKQKVNITLPELHPGQIEVRDHPARFKVIAAGRRWRKTALLVILGISLAIELQTIPYFRNMGRKGGGIGWYVGPDYPMVAIAWRMAHNLIEQ